MNIQVLDNNNKINTIVVNLDPYGNIYFSNNDNLNDSYQVNVSGKNIPFLDHFNYEIEGEYNKNIGTFTLIDKHNSLKTKLKMKIQKENNYDDDEENSDDEYDLDGDKLSEYYPEDDDHVNNEDNEEVDEIYGNDQYIDEDNIKNYGYDNKKFDFWSSGSENIIPILYRKDSDIMALYDTYIYDNNNLIFKSNSPNNDSIYRFRLNTSGEIYYRIIGQVEKKFKLMFNENNNLNIVEFN
jgi:hypothetical protein